MKHWILLCVTLFAGARVSAQLGAVAGNYYDADKLLQQAEKSMSAAGEQTCVIRGAGKEWIDGHFEIPARQDTGFLQITLDVAPDRYNAAFEMRYKGDAYVSRYRFSGDTCYFLDYGDTTVFRQSPKKHMPVYFYAPAKLLSVIEKNKHTIHTVDAADKNCRILGFNDEYGNKFYACYDLNKNVFKAVWMPAYDPVVGDYFETILYEQYRRYQGISFPAKITHNRGNTRYRTIEVQGVEVLSRPPADTKPAWGDFAMDTISDHLFLVKLLGFNNKMMVSKHRNYLSVYDAPVNIQVCRQLIAYLKARFPGFEIRYCFLSHHHPDHAGGVAAFIEAGCRIVSTSGNVSYLNRLHRARHTMVSGMRGGAKGQSPAIESVAAGQSKQYGDKDCPVLAYEIGQNTQHTEEYLVFYFPDDRLLFAADLVLFYKNGVYSQGERAYSVYELIATQKLTVSRIYTGWPLHQFKDYGTPDDLKMCLKAKYPGL